MSVPVWLRSAFLRNRMERELEEEFQFHLEQHIESGLERGLSPAEARAEAIKALDRIHLRKEECRDMRGLNFIDNLTQDLRYALRVLRNSPAFTIVAILSLALGIGANTAIFSVMDVLLLRPLPVKQPESLQLISLSGKERPRYSFNYPMFERIRDRNRVFSQTFAWSVLRLQTPEGSDLQLIPSALASGDYFAGLGVAPALGRVFGPDDDRRDGGRNGPVAVIGDSLWTRRYNRKASALGQSITLNGVAVTIIGVMPPGFVGPEVGTAPDIWVPLNLQRQLQDPRCISSETCWYLKAMGRLNPAVSGQQASANLRAISRQIMEDAHPKGRPDRVADFLGQIVQSESGAAGYTDLRRRVSAPLKVLMALVGFVLLIACANMANLLTARASARQKEVAVRLAIGAGRARVVRQFLTESVLLSVAGAAGGFLIAVVATRVLIAILSTTDNPVILDLRPDWRVLLFTSVAAIGTGLLFGLAPALRSTRSGPGDALKLRTHQIQSSGGRFGFTRILLGLQAALSVVLLAAAGLLAGTLLRLLKESPGFEPHGVTILQLDTTKLGLKGPAILDLYGRIMHAAGTMPGIKSASLMSSTPVSNGGWDEYVKLPGRSDLTDEQRDTDLNAVGPRYLETMRVPLLAGRDFTDGDTPQSAKVAILSENAARRWYPNGALGADILLEDKTLRIVGIAGNTKYWNLREAIPSTMYVPYTQWTQTGGVAIRSDAPVRETLALFRDMLRQVASGAPIRTIKTMDQQIDESLSTERLTAYLSVFFAVLALMLTAVGLYGILAYSVTRRTSEIGLRMALGAQRGNVVWLVISEALGHTALGAIAGIVAVTASSKLIASLLYQVKPNDPTMVLASVAALGLVCAAAAWIPARRASKLDPMVALREE